MQEKLTIWIPTKNRPDFLLRLMKYYKNTGFRGYLFIGDSSEGECLEKNKETIKNYNSFLQINYCEFPDLTMGHVSAKLVPQIETEFSSFLADDDLISTSSIDSCVQYLIDHEAVSGANGKSILFEVESGKAFGEIKGTHVYSLPHVLNSTGQDRLANIISDMKCMNMCIHRTSNQKVIFEKVGKLAPLHSCYVYEELISCIVMSIRGKIVQLPHLFLCRQGHPNQFYHSIDVFDWFTDKDWYSAFKLAEQTTIEELMNMEGITEHVAKEKFKRIFWPYHAHHLTQSWESYRKENIEFKKNFNIKDFVLARIKEVPGAIQVAKKVRKFFNKLSSGYGNMSLPALLSPSSPYNKHFMPFYDIITKKNISKN